MTKWHPELPIWLFGQIDIGNESHLQTICRFFLYLCTRFAKNLSIYETTRQEKDCICDSTSYDGIISLRTADYAL